MAQLDQDQIQHRLRSIQGWSLANNSIQKTFSFQTFASAIDFVNRVARLADAADHHPDIDIRYTRVTLTLSTHSAGGLTNRDFDLAAEIERQGA